LSGALVPLPLRTTIVQQKTGRPVPFELTERTREALASWLHLRSLRAGEWLFPSRSRPGDHLTARQYGRLRDGWGALSGSIRLPTAPTASA
jgi:site-specific recombinase XerC